MILRSYKHKGFGQMKILSVLGTAALAVFLFGAQAVAQQAYDPGGKARESLYGQGTNPGDTPIGVDSNNNMKVNCETGCSGGPSEDDAEAFTYGSSLFSPVGGVYNSSITPLVSGKAGAVALTPNRSMHVLDDNSAQIQANTAAKTYTHIPTSTDTIVKAAAGVFGGIVVNTGGTLSSATVYDNTTCTGTVLAKFSTVNQVSLPVPGGGAIALTGICVTTADTGGAADITILWQ